MRYCRSTTVIALLVFLLLFLVGSFLPSPTGTASTRGPDLPDYGYTVNHYYPRIASYHGDIFDLDFKSRCDLLVMYNGYGSGTFLDQVHRIREESTGTLMLAYEITEEVPSNRWRDYFGEPINSGWWLLQPYTTLAEDITPECQAFDVVDGSRVEEGDDLLCGEEHMHVTQVSGDRVTVERGYFSDSAFHAGGTRIAPHSSVFTSQYGTRCWMLNCSEYCPEDPQGRTWIEFLSGFIEENILNNSDWDGIFLDQCHDAMPWAEGGNTDADNDGVADAAAGWYGGMIQLLQDVRGMAPAGYLILGNGNFTMSEYGNGSMLETFGVKGWQGEESPGRWGDEIDFYRFWEKAGREPRVFTVNSNTYDTGNIDYRDVRFGLTGTLLGDGYYSYDYGTHDHGQSWWFDEYDNAGEGKGYLGQPLTDAYSLNQGLTTPELLTNGGFENGFEQGWGTVIGEGYDAEVLLESGDTHQGARSLRITNATAGTDWHVQVNHSGIPVQKGVEYTVSFWAKSQAPRMVGCGMRKKDSPFTPYGLGRSFFVDERWRLHQGSFESTGTDEDAKLQFFFGQETGDVLIDDVSFREGSVELYRREFQGGTVICNATGTTRDVQLERTYYHIDGAQDPGTNNGSAVTEVSVPSGDGIILVNRPEEASKTWHLAEGSTAGGFETWVLLSNPGDTQAVVSMTYMTPDEEIRGGELTLLPRTRTTVNVADAVPDECSVSTTVTSDMPVVAERAMYWNGRAGGHDSIGVTSPARSWYLAEGSTAGGFETWVLVQNPSDETAEVSLTYLTTGGPVEGPAFTLESHRRKTINVAEVVPDQWSVSTTVASGVPVIAERAMYWNGREGGHDSIGVSIPSKTWHLAEGSTAGGFETWVLLSNPGDTQAVVSMTYMTPDEEIRGGELTLLPRTRTTVNVADAVPDECSVSTTVTSDMPVVAERAMYWNGRAGGHDSIGVTSPARSWYLAEGSTAGGFETWVLVQNPSDETAEVSLTYLTTGGPVEGPAFTLESHRRKTINVAEVVPDQWSVSTTVASGVPVIAERAMYWNGREGGHDSIGHSNP